MLVLALGTALSFMQVPCSPSVTPMVVEARARADELDLAGAAEWFHFAAEAGCADAAIGAWYLRGLVDAREAFRLGGSPESLIPVRQAIASLEVLGKQRPGAAEIARLTLQAAAAAAQSERAEMRLYLESAMTMDSLQRAAGQTGAPGVAAAEAAGDLWLQVHQYEDARRAYTAAEAQVGLTRRVAAGLARVAARLDDAASACANYGKLLARWPSGQAEPPDIAEARNYLARPVCVPAGP